MSNLPILGQNVPILGQRPANPGLYFAARCPVCSEPAFLHGQVADMPAALYFTCMCELPEDADIETKTPREYHGAAERVSIDMLFERVQTILQEHRQLTVTNQELTDENRELLRYKDSVEFVNTLTHVGLERWADPKLTETLEEAREVPHRT